MQPTSGNFFSSMLSYLMVPGPAGQNGNHNNNVSNAKVNPQNVEIDTKNNGQIIIEEEEKNRELAIVNNDSWSFADIWSSVYTALYDVGKDVIASGAEKTRDIAETVVLKGVFKALAKVELPDKKRAFLRTKCQPFTDQALPIFAEEVVPVISEYLQLRWGIGKSDEAQQLLTDVPQDLILILTSRILNFFDPSLRLVEELFEIGMTTKPKKLAARFEEYAEKCLHVYLMDKEDPKLLLLIEELKEIGKIENEKNRNIRIKKFAAKSNFAIKVKIKEEVDGKCVYKEVYQTPTRSHPLAALVNELLRILRIPDRANPFENEIWQSSLALKLLEVLEVPQQILDASGQDKQKRLETFQRGRKEHLETLIKQAPEYFAKLKQKAQDSPEQQRDLALGMVESDESVFYAMANELGELFKLNKGGEEKMGSFMLSLRETIT